MKTNKYFIYNTGYLNQYILSKINIFFKLVLIFIIICLNIFFNKSNIFSLEIGENILNKCSIKNSQAPVIKEYANKVDKFITEINKDCEIKEYTKQQIKDFNIKVTNNVITGDLAYKEVYSYLGLRNTSFYYFRFSEENKNIYNIYTKANQNLAYILQNCNEGTYEGDAFEKLKGDTKLQAAKSVMQNSIKVWDLYHNILVGNLTYNKLDTNHTKYDNIFGLGEREDYIKELNKYYGLDAFKICELETNEAKTSAKLIKEITTDNIKYKNIFKKWKIASLKLAGIYGNEKQVRKGELNNELERRLQEEKYAIDKLKTNNQNSSNQDFELNTGKEGAVKNVSDSANKNTFNNQNDINNIISAVRKIGDTDNSILNDDNSRTQLIKYANLLSRYAERRSIAESNNYRTNTVVQNLLKAHVSLTKTLRLITETIDLSEQVCNSQATGLGICEY